MDIVKLLALLLLAAFHLPEIWVDGFFFPIRGMFFMPDAEGWLHFAFLDDPSKRAPVVPDRDIRFFLWTKKNPTDAQLLVVNSVDSVTKSHFGIDKTTKVIIHGYSQSATSDFILNMRNAYFQLPEDYNVIAVDWKQLSRSPRYKTAVVRTADVGLHTARLIEFLVEQGASLSNFHLIGFSLGAHACGITGRSITKGKIQRITGLDPASPGYDRTREDHRLDRSDALFVDVIHSNAKLSKRVKGLGLAGPLGHADFYPNGGNSQPGCLGHLGNQIYGCSHRRSSQYFMESITNSAAFPSIPCSSYEAFTSGGCGRCGDGTAQCAPMGESVPHQINGSFYLRTRAFSPYTQNN